MNNKRLYRSNNRKLFGICGGIAEYLGVDPFWVRLIWAITALAWGTSILVYFILVFVMDNRPDYLGRNISDYSYQNQNYQNYQASQTQNSVEKRDYIDAEPVGFRYHEGEKEEVYR